MDRKKFFELLAGAHPMLTARHTKRLAAMGAGAHLGGLLFDLNVMAGGDQAAIAIVKSGTAADCPVGVTPDQWAAFLVAVEQIMALIASTKGA